MNLYLSSPECRLKEQTKEAIMFDNIYDRIEEGGDVYEDIADMSLSEMEDYFGDLDPIVFL
jgi:uncharacterized protein YabN with tetrapyrrole methylase and pyrophosphatase domain